MTKKHTQNILLKIFFLLTSLAATTTWISMSGIMNNLAGDTIATFGYIGILAASVLSGFNIIVPIPIIVFLPAFIALGLHFWFTIFVIAIGMTLGDILGYLVGDVSRSLLDKGSRGYKTLKRLERFREQYHALPLGVLFFYVAFVPFPNELLVIPLAFMGYRLMPILIITILGNLVFNTLLAFGVINVVEIFL